MDPKVVGDEFAKQYYLISKSLPHELHRFYTDASYIGRLIGQDRVMRVSTLSDIGDNINVLSSGGFDSAEVTSIVSQDSEDGNVMVDVGGYFTFKETLERSYFTQTFILYLQEEKPKNVYIVLNDILRFHNRRLPPVAERVSEPNDGLGDVSKISDASPAIQDDQAQHPPARQPAKAVGDEFAKQYFRLLREFPQHLDKVYQDNSQIARPVEGGMMRVFTFSEKHENLNMLSSGGFDSAEVTCITSTDSQNGGVLVIVSGYFTLNMRRERDFMQTFFLAPQEAPNSYFVFTDIFNFVDNDGRVVSGEDSKASILSVNDAALTEECSSVHVRSIPPGGRNIPAIRDAFKRFGRIKNGGIRIINPGWNYCYAFVEFEEANAAKRAIKASRVWIAGRLVEVSKPRSQGFLEQRKTHEEEEASMMLQGGTSEQLGDFDLWDWLKSMQVESILHGDCRVGDYSQSQVMEEHRKFLEELQRKHDDENQN
ncbi:unnamed protein product [Thlaspi arvense]|uniref:Uncharacterized protein n=1 Tax=Thlaspi arvense TaxID=13288 RepID=A0AAU9RXK7_THLAR|nr:unnamed protein product [Thlaspi arvense]